MTKKRNKFIIGSYYRIKLDPSMKWEIARYDTNGNFNTTFNTCLSASMIYEIDEDPIN